jgi:hypothetical protein
MSRLRYPNEEGDCHSAGYNQVVDLNPYESPKEIGYRTPEQTAQEARTRDRLMLLAVGGTAYVAIMGLVVAFSFAQAVLNLSEETAKGWMVATITCFGIIGWIAYFMLCRAKRGAS